MRRTGVSVLSFTRRQGQRHNLEIFFHLLQRLALAFERFRGGETLEDLRRLLTPGIRARQVSN